jgi:UDP:flavonoid glycosyltransferase YjiC (YdhE family)
MLDAPADYTPPPELENFLASNPPPVAMGFSSQVDRKTRHVIQMAVDALAQTGQPGILIAGWSRLQGIELAEHMFPIRSVPYDWLFPRIAAMIHHGGSGSTAMALRAGLPNMAVPFGYEQELWGRQIAARGAGVDPILPGELTLEKLTDSIRRLVEDEKIRTKAAHLGEMLRAEDGIGTAVRIVEQTLTKSPAPIRRSLKRLEVYR